METRDKTVYLASIGMKQANIWQDSYNWHHSGEKCFPDKEQKNALFGC